MKKVYFFKNNIYFLYFLLFLTIFLTQTIFIERVKFNKFDNYQINVKVNCQNARAFNKTSIENKKIFLDKNNYLSCKTTNKNEMVYLEYIYSIKKNEDIDFPFIKKIIFDYFENQIKYTIKPKERLIYYVNEWYNSNFENFEIQKKILNYLHSNAANSHLSKIKKIEDLIIDVNYEKIDDIENINKK